MALAAGERALRIEFPPALMTREVAAYYISRSLRELDDLRASGALIAVGKGTKRIFFRKSELDRWVARQEERPVKDRPGKERA